MKQSSRRATWCIFILFWTALGVNLMAVSGPPSPWTPSANLELSPSADPTVTGYFLYYGTNSGAYTSKLDIGTNMDVTVTNLAAGQTYYFSATSYNASGVESAFLPEISYLVPGILTLTPAADGSLRIQFPVAVQHYYDLQASTDLLSWNPVWTTPLQASNVWLEYDQPVMNTAGNLFYRLVLH